MDLIIRNREEIEPVNDVCGPIRILLSGEDSQPNGIAEATILLPTIPHFHKKTTEQYYVLSGEGKLIISNIAYTIQAGMLIVIPPYKAHFTIPKKAMRVLAITYPPWSADDQIVLRKDNEAVGYSVQLEREWLINAFLPCLSVYDQKIMSQTETDLIEGLRKDIVQHKIWNETPIERLREFLRIKQPN